MRLQHVPNSISVASAAEMLILSLRRVATVTCQSSFAISLFVDQLMRFILKFRNADGSETDIEMALHEALVNCRDARQW